MPRTSLAEVRRLESALNDIDRRAIRDLRSQLPRLDDMSPARARDALIDLTVSAGITYGEIAASTAAEWYEDDRRRNVGSGSYAAVLADVDDGPLEALARYTIGPAFDGEEIMSEMLVNGVESYLDDAGRKTVARNAVRDRANGGFYRIPEPDACDFCILLHDRGAVYSEDTVDFAAHTNCKCMIGSAWDDQNAPEPNETARRVSEYVDNLSPQQRDRRRRENRTAIDNAIERYGDRIAATRSEL